MQWTLVHVRPGPGQEEKGRASRTLLARSIPVLDFLGTYMCSEEVGQVVLVLSRLADIRYPRALAVEHAPSLNGSQLQP
eukprot:3721886-Prorocentrum_lima.AAC.1